MENNLTTHKKYSKLRSETGLHLLINDKSPDFTSEMFFNICMNDNNPSQFEALNFQNLQTPYVDLPEILFDWQWAFFSLEL